MAGLSLPPRRLRSKNNSPTPSPLLLTPDSQRLTPRLPPIEVERPGKSPRTPPPSPAPWSWYHRNCHHSPKPQLTPVARRRQNPEKTSRPQTQLDEEAIKRYLDTNPRLVTRYWTKEVPTRALERWVRLRRRLDGTSPGNGSGASTVSASNQSIKFEKCTNYVARQQTTASSSVRSENMAINLPSVLAIPESEVKRDSVLVLDGRRQKVSCYVPRSASAEIRARKHIDRSTNTLPISETTESIPVHRQSNVMRPDRPDTPMKSDDHTDSYSLTYVTDSLSEVEDSCNSVRQMSYRNDEPIYANVVRQEVMNRHDSSNGYRSLSNGHYYYQNPVTGAVRIRRVLPAVLDERKKNVLSIIRDLVIKLFPEAATELYLDLQNDVYIVNQTSLEHTSEQHMNIVRRVIFEGTPWHLSRYDMPRNSGFPKHVVHRLSKNHHVVFLPFKFEFGSIVLELWSSTVYTLHEKILIETLPELVNIVLPYQKKYHSLLQESQMSDFLLQVAQAVFEEMLSLDQLIKKILEVAQHLVNADRASLFLVDHRNLELVSTVFDLRYDNDQDSDFSKKEIRMPINKGIAGHVATSGETMNIPDAYLDQRFNKAVDEATGYRTVSILCMPIKVRGKILAVVQMVNKRDKEAFGADDESAFQVFSTFFGLALHHAKLYDKIKRKEQKYKVALEVLGYHNTCSEEDVKTILRERKHGGKINYNDFALNPFDVTDVEKCKGILIMFEDLFDISKFDVSVLTRFVLTVKKNYRKVPYHNFDHGWAVANSMYVMLKHDTEKRFNFNNRLALFVASLCHDLDHRGYTNKFMSEIASPLAAIYTTSTLEHHHFNMTVTILQQDGHNIFFQMSSEEYKNILDSIRQCILATDLAAFFPNLKKINKLVLETSQFDWNDESHRVLGQSFCMTGADLSASAKPFDAQLRTVQIIFDEFYQQGDLERQAGRSPIAMMDRHREDQLPSCQVGFLSQICIPCYKILSALFPNTKPMMNMVAANLETWKLKAKEMEKTKEE